mgnify:CR=1 FL=1|jgi:hypothetical protein|tara:strand:+ start:412 stop:1068 length:657 start_codon:yes stop_codon:yes gene_type:complete
MSGITIHTEPAQEPVTLQEVKEYLRVEDSTDERTIRPLIETARRFAEEHMGRILISTTFQQFYDSIDEMEDPLWEGVRQGPYLNYYKNRLILAKGPVTSVTHVKTYNDSDVATTMASSKYYLDSAREPARLVLRTGETFPTALRVANAIEVQFVAGYSSMYAIPEPIRLGILQHIAHLYEHRGDMYEAKNPYPPMLKSLYAPYVIHKGLGSSTIMNVG